MPSSLAIPAVPPPLRSPTQLTNPSVSAQPTATIYRTATFHTSDDGKEQYYSCGGVPSFDFSKIVSKQRGNLNCLRPASTIKHIKTYKLLKDSASVDVKFSDTHNFAYFRDKLNNCLKMSGFDTIAHLLDFAGSTKIYNAVKECARFQGDIKAAIELARSFASKHFEEMDWENSKCATEILLARVDNTLSKKVCQHAQDDDPFLVYWFLLLNEIKSISSSYYDTLRQYVTDVKPTNYAHCNIAKLVEDIRPKVQELLDSDNYRKETTVNLLSSIAHTINKQDDMAACEFVISVNQEIMKIKAFNKSLKNLTVQEEQLALSAHKFDPLSMLDFIKELYDENLREDRWAPAKNATDTRAVPKSIQHASTPAPSTTAPNSDLASLVPVLIGLLKANNSTKPPAKKGNCHNCGRPGHWSPDCPEKKSSSSSSSSSAKSTKASKKWKSVAPASGESPTKKVGRHTFNWCGKCSRWTTTHFTATHTGGPNSIASIFTSTVVSPIVTSVSLALPFFSALRSSIFNFIHTADLAAILGLFLWLTWICFLLGSHLFAKQSSQLSSFERPNPPVSSAALITMQFVVIIVVFSM